MFVYVTGCTEVPETRTGVQVAKISTRFEKMDPATGSLTPIDRTEVKRSSANMILAGGKVYLIGGFGEDFALTGTVEAFDPVAGTWATLTPWPTPRLVTSVVEAGGRICASPGAVDVNLSKLASVWDCYDIAADTWETLTAVPGKKDSISLGTHGSELYMLGGFDLSAGKPMDRAFRYDRSASSWHELAALPAPCDTRHTITVGDTLYVLGCNTDMPQTGFFAYDVTADSWSTPPPPPGTADNYYPNKPEAYGDGLIYFSKRNGGEVWQYDAMAKQWSVSPPLPARAGSFTSVLASDKLYVRLFTEEPFVNTIEDSGKIFAYDLTTSTWAKLPEADAETNLYLQGAAEGGSIYYAGDSTEFVIQLD